MNAAIRIFLPALLALLMLDVRAQQAYPSPDAAVEALIVALGTERGDPERLGALLGADWQTWIPTDNIERKDVDAQGQSAPGGAYAYRIGDNMSRGFALVAWPAEYADSGVMSFMLSHDGQVFEKDMGPDSAKLAMAMSRFDPDSSWDEVAEPAAP